MSTEASRKATAERAERHRKEVDAALEKAETWRAVAYGMMVLIAALLVAFAILVIHPRQKEASWRTDVPPARQKVEIVTYGWWHPSKGWCSYETGETISVTYWR